MSSAFIFDRKSKSFIKNEEISNIPCLAIDEKKQKNFRDLLLLKQLRYLE